MFADDGEDIEEMREPEEIANLLAQVDEFEARSGGFGGDVQTNESAKARAVGVPEIGEIEDDALVARDEGANAVEENIGDAGDQLAVAAHNDDAVSAVFHIERKDWLRCGIRHGESPFEDLSSGCWPESSDYRIPLRRWGAGV